MPRFFCSVLFMKFIDVVVCSYSVFIFLAV